MKDIIITAVVLVVLALAIYYIIKQKKNGVKCIGCPSGGCCPNQKGGSCSCTSKNKQ